MLSKLNLISKQAQNIAQIAGLTSNSSFNFAAKTNKELFNYSEEVMENVFGTAPKSVGSVNFNSTALNKRFAKENLKISHTKPTDPKLKWKKFVPYFTMQEAIREANRCLKCANPPCQKACTTNIDVRAFIYNIEQKNWYGAAKAILSNNPLGLSCGQCCPVENLCAGSCNLKNSNLGPIAIGRLQELAMKVFKEMKVKQIRNPNLKDLPESFETKIALIGCGPASISCASFLGRLGYNNVHIYEKEKYGGGMLTQEITQSKIPMEGPLWEIEQMKQLGVKVFYGKQFGEDGLTIDSLKKDGYQAIFIGTGLTEAHQPFGNEVYRAANAFTSKDFLKQLNENVKNLNEKNNLTVSGTVLTIGGGDTALDVAENCLRYGASKSIMAFMSGLDDMNGTESSVKKCTKMGVNFVPYVKPKKINFHDSNGRVKSVTFSKYMPTKQDKKIVYKEFSETIEIPCDYLVTAVGTIVDKNDKNLSKFLNRYNKMDIDEFGQSRVDKSIFAGGDVAGGMLLVDAVNDGKMASWGIHKYIQEKNGQKVSETPELPKYYTEIDNIDLGVNICGVKFSNPFGLASAPPTTSYPMIKRAFDEGWGFAVIKTVPLDKDTVTNYSPRIFKSTADTLQTDPSFANIELISEKSWEYWKRGAKEIKKQYPDKVLIGSAMCAYVEEDWKEAMEHVNEAGFDLVELNLSCPHGMPDKGMGRAVGENPELVKNISMWCKKYAKMPVIVKITPNYGWTDLLVKAAKEGGADAVTLTNTMPSLMDPKPDGTPWPSLGEDKKTAAGGAAGAIIRPFSMLKLCQSAKVVKGIEYFGSGGIVNGQHAMAFIRYGAKAFQICSSVQNLDVATISYDLHTGLRAHMYLAQREDLQKEGWSGQQPPSNIMEKYEEHTKFNEKKLNIPTIEQLCGTNLSRFGNVTENPNDLFFVPEIDEEKCIKCGRCFLTCADSGYQAFKFKNEDQFPCVEDEKCTGCGLCYAVCPVPGALNFVPRKTPYIIKREIPPGPKAKDYLKEIPVKSNFKGEKPIYKKGFN